MQNQYDGNCPKCGVPFNKIKATAYNGFNHFNQVTMHGYDVCINCSKEFNELKKSVEEDLIENWRNVIQQRSDKTNLVHSIN